MRPPLNFGPPQHANQFQCSGASAPQNPQVLSSNPSPGNASFVMQNSMQMQSQMGMFNRQVTVPSNYCNTLLSNGQSTPVMLPLMAQQTGFMSLPNQLGLSQMSQCQMGFSEQNFVNNFNALPLFGNQMGQCQPVGHNFATNFSNFPQQLLHNLGFQNLQAPNIQIPIQTLNHAASMQILNHSQGSLRAVGPQNHNFSMMAVGQQAYPNDQNLVLSANGGNTSKPMLAAAQGVQGNLSAQNSQSSAFSRQQRNRVENDWDSSSNFNGKNFRGKYFKRNVNKEASHSRHQKSQFNHIENRKRKFAPSNGQKEKGHGHKRAKNLVSIHPMDKIQGNKRSLILTYSEEEIKMWREQRRRNYPSNANIEKAEKLADSDVMNREAKLRRELKEILSKQAAMGVEVAEIPSHYLTDSQKQEHQREENGRMFSKKGRSRNRHAKRGRGNKNKWPKQQTCANGTPSERKLTLLQKLLSSDIRRDKCRLLQVLRFMVINSFFKDWPEKALEFPLVEVKEESSLVKNVSEIKNKTLQNMGDDVFDNEDDERVDADCYGVEHGKLVGGEDFFDERTEEEEGEIIDFDCP
ncbi:hypothetical protein K2173_024112 [Erythroxylum novogranatense]|uniref:FMR1-interacting protein 1 conserved domain-containing protein n=1 Tax=Erythroxylum novogranatense TaxID=1862640 RepID=A0AAV8UET2_9ROSI|nr:hypothetical protein K2173_024112 [Erythroxylum novogranatense]